MFDWRAADGSLVNLTYKTYHHIIEATIASPLNYYCFSLFTSSLVSSLILPVPPPTPTAFNRTTRGIIAPLIKASVMDRTCEYVTLLGKGDFEAMLRVWVGKWSWINRWAQSNHIKQKREAEEWEIWCWGLDPPLLALKTQEGATSPQQGAEDHGHTTVWNWILLANPVSRETDSTPRVSGKECSSDYSRATSCWASDL